MTGQGKGMPGMAAFGADDENAPQGATGSAGAGSNDLSAQGAAQEGVTAPAAAPQQADIFDSWLRAELSRLYDTTLSEPVPPDMLRLLNGAKKG